MENINDFIKHRNELLQAWTAAKKKLEEAKHEESLARREAIEYSFKHDFNNAEDGSASATIDLANGWRARAVKNINYGWIKNGKQLDTDAVMEALGEISALDDKAAIDLVRWKPELSMRIYKELDNNLKSIIDKVIVTTDATPTLEIIPPKGE